MSERWKIIKEAPNYKVSSYGNVCRATTGKSTYVGRKCGKLTNKDGYKYVALCVNSKTIFRFIHVLVAAAFIGDKPNSKEVNHKDLKKDNNYYRNLEYETHKGNMYHASRYGVSNMFGSKEHKVKGENNHASKLTWRQVCKIRKLYKTCRYSQKELSHKFIVSEVSIWRVIHKLTWDKGE